MATSFNRRLDALEATDNDQAKRLPEVVPDSTPQADLDRVRQRGREVLRFTEFLELCL